LTIKTLSATTRYKNMENNKNFENMMKDLEQIAKELESGELSLDESVKKFEEGMEISKSCSKILEDAEKRITILIKDSNGDVQEENFSAE
jgi:exodeoxyribonuclease VII small subunit